MKRLLPVFVVLFNVGAAMAKLYRIDRTEAIVFGSEASALVTTSDIRMGFDGVMQTKESVIMNNLIFQDALKHRIMVGTQEVDEYIQKIARNMGGTPEDINKLFAASGYTPEAGRQQLAMMYANQQMIDHKVRQRVIVPKEVVEEYYRQHPVQKPAAYVLERAFIPASKDRQEQVKKKIDTYIRVGKGLMVNWRTLPEISEDDLADNKKYITHLAVGQIARPESVEGGFELIRLKSKKPARLVPLEDRYKEIVETLRAPQFEKLYKEYTQGLLAKASMIMFD